jgi:dTDP-4-dehydrorhamnose reductase
MRLLIVGATGLLGQTLFSLAREHSDFEVYGTVRRIDESVRSFLRAEPGQLFECDVTADIDPDLYCAPTVVVNCAGVVKQQGQSQSPATYIRVNALAPQVLADLCTARHARLIQISTDCVFSGQRGGYSETDLPDPPDLYGRTKLLGEVTEAPHLTLRTSFIGFERFHHQTHSLLDWFMQQRGEIRGYTRAIWSGLTSLELAQVILKIAARPEVTGLLHVCGEKISKYELLRLAQKIFDKTDTSIVPYSDYDCDRSLVSNRLADLGVTVPSIYNMLLALRANEVGKAQ